MLILAENETPSGVDGFGYLNHGYLLPGFFGNLAQQCGIACAKLAEAGVGLCQVVGRVCQRRIEGFAVLQAEAD